VADDIMKISLEVEKQVVLPLEDMDSADCKSKPRRMGSLKGQRLISEGYDIDESNEEIAKMFGEELERRQAEKGNSERKLAPLAGGLVSMSDDFDETPECFKEYM
jgi:hypothetical protein